MSGPEVAAEKARLRERFRAARLALAAPARAEASARACERALAELAAGPGDVVALYWPLVARGELDVRPLAEALLARGAGVALPATGAGGRMTMRRWRGEPLAKARWGLREPAADAERVPPSALAAVVLPGLAFGRDGSRLGWGAGFYDRYLAQTPARRVGVTFHATLADALPAEAHDQTVDVVVTEREAIRTAQSSESAT